MSLPWQDRLDDSWKPHKDRDDDPSHYYDFCYPAFGAAILYRRRSPERIAQIEQERALWKLTSPRYAADRACLKCGATNASTSYHREAELMVRNCSCGFEWRELPLDAEGAAP